jgi:hypothetical protein
MSAIKWTLAALLAVGCTGSIGENGGQPPPPPNGGPGPGGGPPPGPTPAKGVLAACTAEVPGRRLLRRLTVPELETSVRSVFGLDANQWKGLALPPDPASLNGFTNNVERLTVGTEYAKGAFDEAKRVATLVSSPALLAKLLPCAAQGDEACAGTFLTNFGNRLYRRPLTAAERTRFLALHTKVRAKGDFASWVYWATVAMVQSPQVLYRSEVGEPAGAGRYKLTPYEVATALSFTFTGGPPGAELTQLAATGKLATADQIEAAARTLVFDAQGKVLPAFRQVVLGFAEQWLGLSPLANAKKDPLAFADFTDAVADALAEETRRFLGSVVLDDRGKPTDLLTASYTFVDPTLARFYGFGKPAAGTFLKVPRPEGWGVGLLAQGAIMAIEAGSLSTSPTKRGHLVRTRFLCDEVPPPPPVVAELPEPTDAETTRQRYEMLHATEQTCRTCHRLIDSIGFAFEHLDATGRFRAREGRFDIDDSAEVVNTSAGNLAVKGPTELALAVSKLPEVSDCMAAFMASNAFGMDHHDAACMVRTAAEELRAGKLSIVDFYLRMARSEHFRTRTP